MILKMKQKKVYNILLGDSPASEFYAPMFQNTLSHRHRPCEQEESEVWNQEDAKEIWPSTTL